MILLQLHKPQGNNYYDHYYHYYCLYHRHDIHNDFYAADVDYLYFIDCSCFYFYELLAPIY